MYYSGLYVTIGLLVAMTPLYVPVRLKSIRLRRIRRALIVCFFISVFVTFTPDIAKEGAPIHKFKRNNIAFLTCEFFINRNDVMFCDLEDSWLGSCFCKNPNARATMAYCFQVTNPDFIQGFLDKCADDFSVVLTQEDFEESLKNYSLFSRRPDELHLPEGAYADFPIKIDKVEAQEYFESMFRFTLSYNRSVQLGGLLVIYWLVFFLVVAVANWSKLILPGLHKQAVGPVTNWIRKNITTPATYGKKKTNEKPFLKVLDLLCPTRLETISLMGFFILSVWFFFDNVTYVDGDPIFTKRQAYLRLYAIRCSILTSSLMPLLILFGGRNNFLQEATRLDYSTFITLHRWVSRVVVLMVLIHTLFYTLYAADPWRMVHKTYIKWGILGTTSGIAILVQGLLVLRRKYYELFLVLHILLAFGFIFGAYIHVYELSCLWFYHFTFAVWIMERIVRILSLVEFGFPKAKVMLLADEALKVVIPKPAHWDTVPGGHVFIHFLRPLCFWQSHPFTYTISIDNQNEIIIFIKVKEGVTKSLYDYLKSHAGKSTEIRVAVEGSYGETTPASRYNTAVFVAGGNGIPGIYAEAYDLASKHINQKIDLIWVVREYRSLYWFYEELLSLRNTKINTTIYVTRPDSYVNLGDFDLRFPLELEASEDTQLKATHVPNYLSVDLDDPEKIIANIKRELSFVTFKEGRPCIDGIVKEAIKLSEGSSAFITCGHPVMVDDLRAAVADNIDNPEHKRIDYFEQLQVWA